MNSPRVSIPHLAAIETEPPAIFASRLALREGNHRKPIYQIHKWWARRLGSVFRSLILASTTTAKRASILTNGFFYKRHDLAGLRVLDPFVGGGTSLIEAAKCGASVIGVDIDPVACFITAKELEAYDERKLLAGYAFVEKKVKDELLKWYRTKLPDGKSGAIIYAFWVDRIKCPICRRVGDGHHHFQLRRFRHDRKQVVLCRNCGELSTLPLRRRNFTCHSCLAVTKIDAGPVKRNVYHCPECKTETELSTLAKSGRPLRQRLFALEVRADGSNQRIFKKAGPADLARYRQASRLWAVRRKTERFVPREAIPVKNRDDRRPISSGYKYYRDLFNPRQLLCLSILASAISSVENLKVREFLALAFSDCLAANNMFCFYAFDYGKLTPLFGLHAYAKISRPVENNVWGTEAGRGSFSKCFFKLLEGKRYANKPYEYLYDGDGQPRRHFTGEKINSKLYKRKLPDNTKRKPGAVLLNQSATTMSAVPSRSIDLILSDPPYYNNLAYSELSDFYHVWLKRLRLKSYTGNGKKQTPLKESFYVSKRTSESGSHERFAEGLAQTFVECHRVLKDQGLFVFTFHHNEANAWAVVARALLGAGFQVTNVFPVRSEGQSQFHSAEGSLKWDQVMVCRKRPKARPPMIETSKEHLTIINSEGDTQAKAWKRLLSENKLEFSNGDARSLRSAFMLMLLSQSNSIAPNLESFFSESYKSDKVAALDIGTRQDAKANLIKA